MYQSIKQLAAYSVWANNEIIAVLQNLTQEQLHQPVTSSFSSIYLTVQHMCMAECNWYKRVFNNGVVHENDLPFEILIQNWQQQTALWLKAVNGLEEAGFEQIIDYHNLKREAFSQPLWQILVHLYNHATFHRGQLITLLRQVGVTTLPATDFIVFTRLHLS